MADLKLIVLDSAEDLGIDINRCLKNIRQTDQDFRVPIKESRFSNGEGKIEILETVRDSDVFILGDIGNYDKEYKMHDRIHYMSPDEHFQDMKRVIAATSGHAQRVNLIMPLLYESRQDKRKGRESLDCAVALQEVDRLGIKSLITFDAHAPSIANAVPTLSFENFYPTSRIIESIYENEHEGISDMLVIAPDFGAMDRARYYSEMIGCDVGCFYKRRDLSKLVDGKNPIVDHLYLGPDVKDKNILIVDDMISSGASVLDVCNMLKERGAKKVFICTTFALFTEGIKMFENAYNQGLFDTIYSTNVSYVPQSIKDQQWFYSVDCSEMIADIINRLNKGESIEPLHRNKCEVYKKLRLLKDSKQ